MDNENLPLPPGEGRGEGAAIAEWLFAAMGEGKGPGGILRRDSRQENSRLVVETTRQNYNLGFFHLVHKPMFTVYPAGPAACQLES